METNNRSESVYTVSEETSQWIHVFKKLIAVQEETLLFLAQQGVSGSKEGEIFAENIGAAISQFGSILWNDIYDRIINSEFEL